MWPRRVRHGSPDAGESLIESLVTIAILGVAVVALLGALLLGVQTSVQHRKHAQAQAELRSWAERVSGAYTHCPGPEAIALPPSLPAGLTASVEKVEYWNGSSFQASCPALYGLHRVSLKISVAAGIHPAFSEKLDVVVRRPCAVAALC